MPHPRQALWFTFALASATTMAADAWVQRVGNGFGDASNVGIGWLQVFNGKVYAAVGQDNTGSGNLVSVWQSADLANWTRVLGPLSGQTDVFFGTASSTAIFFGTRSSALPAQVWRSSDGTTWTQFNGAGTGYVGAGNFIVAALGIFGPDLYAGFNNPNGGQVWRRAVDGSNNWTKVLDFANGTGIAGAGGVLPTGSPTFLHVSRGTLYLSTFGSGATQNAFLFQTTNGTTWTRNNAVGNGFGDPNNLNIASLIEFGDFLYASVHNTTTGGQVWRTAAVNAAANGPTPWQKVVGNGSTLSDGFGSGAGDLEVHHLDVGLGYLWATNINVNTGTQVWRTTDGVSWTQSNVSGFTGGLNIRRGFPTVEVFGNQMVWAGGSATGAQVWSLPSISEPPPPPPPPSAPSRIINLSILTSISAAGENFTMGYVVGGDGTTGPKPLVIRAAGPSLGALGVAGTLADPKLELFAGSAKTGENNDWGGSAALVNAMAAVGAFAYTGPTSLDAAVAVNISTRDNSVMVSANGSGTGLVIAEVYDATPETNVTATTPRLINVSVLKNIGSGLTAGFVIRGPTSKTVLIRAIGPTLGTLFQIPGVVANPQLVLFGANQARVGENDNWGGTASLGAAFTAVGAFALPSASQDAALLATLVPGDYSVVVTGVGNTTGLALVEVYDVP